MSTASKSETQQRLRKEKAEQQAKTAKQRADRLAAEAKNKDALEQSAKRVAALYQSMRKFEEDAEKKAGFELKKAAQKRAALEKALAEARELCKAAGQSFKEFQEKYAPEYTRSQLYQVLAIADGRTTVEDVREGNRERKRRQRAAEHSQRDGWHERPADGCCELCNKNVGVEKLVPDHDHDPEKFRGWLCGSCNTGIGNLGDRFDAPGVKNVHAYLSVTSDVTDDASPVIFSGRETIEFPEHQGGSQPVLVSSGERPIEQVQAEFAALAGEEVPPAGGSDEIDTGKPADDGTPAAETTPVNDQPDHGTAPAAAPTAKSSAVNAADTALDGFTVHVLDLIRRIAKHQPKRFAGTAVPGDELQKLGEFFTELGHIKSSEATSKVLQ